MITSLAICCTLISAISFARSIDFFNYQLFFIPIIYAAFFINPKCGLLVAFICGLAYQAAGYSYRYPDNAALTVITSEAVLFVIIDCMISYFIKKIHLGETHYQSTFEHSQLGRVMFGHTDFIIRQTNTRFVSMHDYFPEGVIGKPFFLPLCLTSSDKERFLERIGKSNATENFETHFTTKSGAGYWVNPSWNRIDDVSISCTAANINGREIAEKLNSDNMTKYSQLTENSPNGILLIQHDFTRFSNRSFSGLSGYSKNELAGKNLADFVAPRDKDEFIEFSKHGSEHKQVQGEKEIRFIT
ncbi:MAG: PAS domain S-box protein [Methanomicrobiales archaeon]